MQPDAVMYQPDDIAFVVLAGGQGSRMQQNTPKQFLRVAGKTILEHTVDALLGSVADSVSAKPLPRTIVVVPADALSWRLRGGAERPRREAGKAQHKALSRRGAMVHRRQRARGHAAVAQQQGRGAHAHPCDADEMRLAIGKRAHAILAGPES
jgi:CTP:molybdopterin cytidylyltransferase MocA